MDDNISVHERLAIVELHIKRLDAIETKLDQLLQLKAQGMGALSLVTIIVGSGALGLITLIVKMLHRGAS